VVIHPQSVVHSLVEYIDGSVLAQLGSPDMRIPIAYALAYPQRMATPCERLDLVKIGSLDFEEPDLERFPALALAKAALSNGGAKPAILNAANEIAVASFLDRKLGFLDIARIARETLDDYDPPAPASLDEVLEVDGEARRRALSIIGKYQI
jgi:1-deoxy-D-xylulose-5-phosphate reductoisomerase